MTFADNYGWKVRGSKINELSAWSCINFGAACMQTYTYVLHYMGACLCTFTSYV